MRIFLPAIAAAIVVCVSWATLRGVADPEPNPALSGCASGSQPATGAVENGRPFPRIRAQGSMLSPRGEVSALLEVDRLPATWYRRGDAIQPGFIVTAIDGNQVTVRDEPRNAYYEIPLNGGPAD